MRPRWVVESCDGAHVVVVSGALRATFQGNEPFFPGESVFVRLRELGVAAEVWPAVGHLPTAPAPSPSRPWAGALATLCQSLPWPLEGVLCGGAELSIIAVDASPNEYAPLGADFGSRGELELAGGRLVAMSPTVTALLDGDDVRVEAWALREASPGECAWLVREGHAREEEPALVLAVAATQEARGGPAVAAVIGGTPRWTPHEPSTTSHLDKALDALVTARTHWPDIVVDGDVVTAHVDDAHVVLGHAAPRAARRWALAANLVLRDGP
jgi:hypothetical protein